MGLKKLWYNVWCHIHHIGFSGGFKSTLHLYMSLVPPPPPPPKKKKQKKKTGLLVNMNQSGTNQNTASSKSQSVYIFMSFSSAVS